MLEENDAGVHGMMTFLLEGVLLLAVALVGLIGNLISFITIFRQKIQKTFHNLLFLLTVFDMVRVPAFLHSKCKSLALYSIRNSSLCRCGCDVGCFYILKYTIWSIVCEASCHHPSQTIKYFNLRELKKKLPCLDTN